MFALIDRFERLMLRLGMVSGFATLLITLIVFTDVVGRGLFNTPLPVGVEVSELLLVSLVFMGLAAAQQRRQNFAIDLVYNLLPARGRLILDYLGLILCIGIIVALAIPSWAQAFDSFRRGETGFGIVAFPIWPARILLTVGLWLLAVQFACDLLRLICNRPRKMRAKSTLDGLLK